MSALTYGLLVFCTVWEVIRTARQHQQTLMEEDVSASNIVPYQVIKQILKTGDLTVSDSF